MACQLVTVPLLLSKPRGTVFQDTIFEPLWFRGQHLFSTAVLRNSTPIFCAPDCSVSRTATVASGVGGADIHFGKLLSYLKLTLSKSAQTSVWERPLHTRADERQSCFRCNERHSGVAPQHVAPRLHLPRAATSSSRAVVTQRAALLPRPVRAAHDMLSRALEAARSPRSFKNVSTIRAAASSSLAVLLAMSGLPVPAIMEPVVVPQFQVLLVRQLLWVSGSGGGAAMPIVASAAAAGGGSGDGSGCGPRTCLGRFDVVVSQQQQTCSLAQYTAPRRPLSRAAAAMLLAVRRCL